LRIAAAVAPAAPRRALAGGTEHPQFAPGSHRRGERLGSPRPNCGRCLLSGELAAARASHRCWEP
jgi:hypothetical protein